MTVTAGGLQAPCSPDSMVVQVGFTNTSPTRMANINYAKFESTIERRNDNLRGLSKSSFSCMDLTKVGKYRAPDFAVTDVCDRRRSGNYGPGEEKLTFSTLTNGKECNGYVGERSNHPRLQATKSYQRNGWVKAGLTLYPLRDVTETQLDTSTDTRPNRLPRQCQSASEIRVRDAWETNHVPTGLSTHPPTTRNCSDQKGRGIATEPKRDLDIGEYLAMSKRYYDEYRAKETAFRKGLYTRQDSNTSSSSQTRNQHHHYHKHVCESLSYTSKSPAFSSASSSSSLHRKASLSRSKSETNLTSVTSGSACELLSEDEDEDGDDYGFLSWSSASLSTAMHKARSPLPTRRILPKRWRSKTKAITTVSSSLWSSEGSCTWCSMSGRRVTLRGTTLLQLSEKERLALQKIALSKLQAMNLGCQICVPKETTQVKRGKRVLKMLKRKSHSANLSTLLDNLKENHEDKDSRDCRPLGLVFGIPIAKCVANDLELQKRRLSRSDAIPLAPHQRKSSNSSVNSLDNANHNGNISDSRSMEQNKNRAASTDSLSESESGKYNSSLLDALSLSLSSHQETPLHLNTTAPQVPQIVKTCFKHLETYGLQTLGIFRVGSTKKRTKQMRDEFDCGKDVRLGEQHNPNDVAALLKEYFRDLPEPLLTRDLYSPLVATRNLYESTKQALAVKMLVALLPVPNRDTLWALLRFLNKVVEHSTDTIDEHGKLLPGNKMDSHNLATLFGPNILHKAKVGSEKSFVVEDMDRAEERSEVIAVLEDMIDFHETPVQCKSDLQDEIVRLLMETDPDTADMLLKKLASEYGIEPDPDTTSSSVFEDSDTASLPHSPGIDMDMGLRSRAMFDSRRSQGRPNHAALRQVQSADSANFSGGERLEVPRLHSDSDPMQTEDSSSSSVPSRVLKPQRSPRMPKLKVSHDKTSTNARGKTGHVGSSENYWSDPYSHDLLTVPSLEGRRKSSGSLTSQEPSPVGSDSSGQWLMTTGSSSSGNSSTNSPRTQPPESPRPSYRDSASPRRQRSDSGSKSTSSSQLRPLSSRQRPLGVRNSEDSRSDSSDLDCERERWRNWELMAADKNDDSYQQETLV
ncbi:rho GTPase-activating protein 6-like [Liolophura sinensis]|uniref:rho GTPase-activating protein 6-like n=1 Tax=Liolophura sinensis TaxID=3198878 RepID=UPI003159513E